MKKWHKRTLAVLAVGSLGTLAFALRPAWFPDAATPATLPPAEQQRLDEPCVLDYAWDMKDSPGITVYRITGQEDAFSLLREAVWHIRLAAEDGQVRVTADAPVLRAAEPFCRVETEYALRKEGEATVRMPRGSLHTVRTYELRCAVTVQRPFWQLPVRTEAVQCLRVDFEEGTADYIEPKPEGQGGGRSVRSVSRSAPLPAKYDGTETERGLQRICYLLADVREPARAEAVGRLLPAYAARLLAYAATEATWPACWGPAQDTACRCSAMLQPTLRYFREHDCFGSEKLAEFLRSPEFVRLFGSPDEEENTRDGK